MLIRKFKQIIQNQSGVGLTEFIVGMAIMLIIMVPMSNTLSAAIKSYQYNMAQNNNITSARLSLNSIEDELRYATAFTISNSGNTIDYTVGGQNRKIYIGSGNNARTLIIEHDKTINKKIATNAVQNINFQRDTNKINITLQLNDNSYAQSSGLSLTNITIVLQNM